MTTTVPDVFADLDALSATLQKVSFTNGCKEQLMIQSIRTRIAALVEAIGPAKYWDHAINDEDRICVPASSCRKIATALRGVGQ